MSVQKTNTKPQLLVYTKGSYTFKCPVPAGGFFENPPQKTIPHKNSSSQILYPILIFIKNFVPHNFLQFLGAPSEKLNFSKFLCKIVFCTYSEIYWFLSKMLNRNPY